MKCCINSSKRPEGNMKVRGSPQGLCSVCLFTVARQQYFKIQHIHRIALKRERRYLWCIEDWMVQPWTYQAWYKTEGALEGTLPIDKISSCLVPYSVHTQQWMLLLLLKGKGNRWSLNSPKRRITACFQPSKPRVAFTGKGVELVFRHWCIRAPAQGCLEVRPPCLSVVCC